MHDFRLHALKDNGSTLELTCEFVPFDILENNSETISFDETHDASISGWKTYWTTGGEVDLSHSADPRADELERRIILSQYILKVNYAGSFPPSECGLVTPTWYGKHNSEVYFIHAAQFYQWGHPELIE